MPAAVQSAVRAKLRGAIYRGEVDFEQPAPVTVGGAYDVTNWRWRAARVGNLPGALQREVLAAGDALDDAGDVPAGSREVGRLAGELTTAHVHEAYDEQRVRDCAENYARLCGRMLTLEQREGFARWLHIDPPDGPTMTREGRLARLADARWWRRQLRKRWTRAAEGALRDMLIVRRGRQPYASDNAVQQRAAQKRKTREFLESHQLVNEQGEQLELLQIAEHSRANPAIRRGELMCRVRGFEETAAQYGHAAEFVTLTTPSRFHAALSAGGRNPAYIRATVRDAQQWLCRMWARARAKLKRLSVLYYGLRVAEPHHDATPHWHLLVFCRPHQVETLRMVLSEIWLSDGGEERGAAAHRVKFETIDRAKGSAVGYVAKYVSKSIDGAGQIGAAEDDETGAAVSDSVARIDAWAATHGIRQFQQLGGPPVGIWREARRLREAVADPDIERVRLAADRGDWAAFIQRVGGIAAGRHTNIRLETAETGERNQYGECRAARVVGLRCASAVVFTRPHTWRIERCSSQELKPKLSGGSSSAGQSCQRPASCGASRCVSSGTGFSDSSRPASGRLGPVAITVRGHDFQPNSQENEPWRQTRKRRPEPPPSRGPEPLSS